MAHQRDKWFSVVAFVFAALTACNRSDDKNAEPRVVELPVPVAATGTAQAPSATGEVKRYGAQEQPLSGSVRVTGNNVKVYAEADNKGQPAQELAQSTLVERKASFGEYSLVAYPTPKGDTDLGWVLTTDLASSPEGAGAGTTVKAAVQTTADAVPPKSTAEGKTKTGDETKADVKTEEKKADEKKADAKTDEKKTDATKDDATKTAEAEIKKATDAAKKAADDAAKAAAEAAAKAGITLPTTTNTTDKK
jgi:hypothetical protein